MAKRTYKTIFLDGNLARAGDQKAVVIIGDDLIEHFGISQAASTATTTKTASDVPQFDRYRTLADAKAKTNPIKVRAHTRNFYSLPGSVGRSGKVVVVDSGISKGNDAAGKPLGNFMPSFRTNANNASISAFIATWAAATRPITFMVNGITRPVLTEAQIKANDQPAPEPTP